MKVKTATVRYSCGHDYWRYYTTDKTDEESRHRESQETAVQALQGRRKARLLRDNI